MPFSIKSEQADELLSQLRELTGEGITEAVTRSLELRLADLKRQPRADADRIRQLAQEFRESFDLPAWQPGDPELSTTHGSLLYDDNGLPR